VEEEKNFRECHPAQKPAVRSAFLGWKEPPRNRSRLGSRVGPHDRRPTSLLLEDVARFSELAIRRGADPRGNGEQLHANKIIVPIANGGGERKFTVDSPFTIEE